MEAIQGLVQFKAIVITDGEGTALVAEVDAQEIGEEHLHFCERQKAGTDHGATRE